LHSKKLFSPGGILYEKTIEQGLLNIDALLSHIYEDLRSALRDNVSLQPLLDFLKQNSHSFLRQKRKRRYATSPTIKSATKQFYENLYRDSA
jgi:hypothetical protein